MNELQQKLYEKVQEQERFLINTRDRLISRNMSVSENTSYRYEVAKMIGYLDCLNIAGVDRTEFNWIFL